MVVSQVDFTIEDLGAADDIRIEGAARLLHAAFAPLGVWTTISEARKEVVDSIAPDRISRVAIAGDGVVIGWIGAIREYDGLVWQLHPIVVDEVQRRRGVGRALILDLEALLVTRGALTLWAGSDDLAGETSLGEVDLYAALPQAFNEVRSGDAIRCRLSSTRVSRDRRDARRNGPGRPDIFLGKRLGT